MKDLDLSVDMLKFLLQSPLRLGTLKHFLRAYTDLQIKQNLRTLQRRGYVVRTGTRRHYLYCISTRGVDYLKRLEQEELLENMKTELCKYIRCLKGGYDL